ncbi:MAG: response regulator transcription factor [Paracoccaceae bacterium]
MPASILLVDDEPNIAFSLEYLMKRDGYEVRTAADGEAALARVREKKPDLVLLDVMMPKRDGYDVCQTLRADPATADVKIVVLTARGGALDGEKALALGADAFFSKPFGVEELSLRVRELLGERPADAS